MQRREFLSSTGLLLSASTLTTSSSAVAKQTNIKPGDWRALRDLFPLTRDYIQLATFLLASHPAPVAAEIERHRAALDENPADYWHAHFEVINTKIAAAAARYMGGQGAQIALTDSTTMGLALVYSGLRLQPDDEILQTVHDHYSTDLSLQHRAERTGARVRRAQLYENPAKVTTESLVNNLVQAISENTKVVAVTWVHSSTGVKLPIRAMADAIQSINQKRDEQDRILFCVDGVHGFGVENQDISKLGCDFFVAGTHKWIFGPRGTGVIWGNERAWSMSEAVIPSFSRSYDVWLGNSTLDQVPIGEHKVQERIHQLNTQTKEGLAAMPHVTLYTPMSSELSAGLVCFDVAGMHPEEVVKRIHSKGIIMSNTPYRQTYARFAPSLINNEQEIDRALAEIKALA